MPKTISPLRQRMIDDMTLRNMSPSTHKVYTSAVQNFSLFFGRPPDKLARCRELLAAPADTVGNTVVGEADPTPVRNEESHCCPCCGGRMVTIETFEACEANTVHARYAIRLDSS